MNTLVNILTASVNEMNEKVYEIEDTTIDTPFIKILVDDKEVRTNRVVLEFYNDKFISEPIYRLDSSTIQTKDDFDILLALLTQYDKITNKPQLQSV